MSGKRSRQARACGRVSLLLFGLNVLLILLVVGWMVVAAGMVSGGGDPPGPAFAYAALVLPALFLGGVLFLGLVTAGATVGIIGWHKSRHLPGRPHLALNVTATLLHFSGPVLLLIGRSVWLMMAG